MQHPLVKYLVYILSLALLILSTIKTVHAHSDENGVGISQSGLELTAEEIRWISDNPIIRSTNDMSWAPIDFVRAGQPAGFSVDYLNLIAEKVGLQVKYVNGYPWSELMKMLEEGKIDVAHGIVKSSGRDEFLDFTDPYLDLPIVFYGRSDAERINNIDDLKDKKIGIIGGFGFTNSFKQVHSDLVFVEYNKAFDGLTALASGEIDLYIGMHATANYAIQSNFISGLKIVGDDLFLDESSTAFVHIAAHKNKPLLINILRKGMSAVSEKEYIDLWDKWHSQVHVGDHVEFTPEELQWIAEHPVLKATNEMDWAPVDFVRDGKAAGFSVDYLNLVAEKIGFKVEYMNGYTWPELMELIKLREIDIAHAISQSEKREEFLDFTGPYLDLPKAFFGRTGAARINTIEDLEGKRIGTISGWASSEILKEKFPHFNFIDFASTEDALVAISKGEIDTFSNRIPITNYIISQNFLPNIEVIGTDVFSNIDSNTYVRLASRNDWPILNSILEKGMSAVSDTEFNDLLQKWRYDFYSNNDLNLSAAELNWLSQNRVLKVIVDVDTAPVEFIDREGNISGIAGDYLAEISRKLNVKFEWAGNETWAEGLEKIQSGEAHIVSTITKTDERLKYLDFTDSYMSASSVIFTREGNFDFVNLQGLSGRTIAQVKNFAIIKYLEENYPAINIVEVETISDALRLVASGEVDAYIGNIQSTTHIIAEESFSQIKIIGETPYKADYSMAIRSDLPLLSSVMKKAMASISEEKRIEISRKWVSIKLENSINYDLIIKIVIGAAICLAIMSAWIISMRREINRRHVVEQKLKEAEARAVSANAAKSSFLANMSHEIRTPLNSIIGFSELMTSGAYGEVSPPRYIEYLHDIEISGRHLATVINDILDLSKIEAGKWQLNEMEFELNACIKSAFKMMETQAHAKQIRLFYNGIEGGAAIEIFGDMTALKRVLINLISNAVKFTEEGGMVICSISRNENGGLVIQIKDTGIGIPPEKMDLVLSPFGQDPDARFSKETGTGLGLCIVKDLIELHGGEFRLESEVNVGTDAIFTLPAERILTAFVDNAETVEPSITDKEIDVKSIRSSNA